MRTVGIYFCVTFVFLNALVFLNVVIAMMADTYAAMTVVRKGLYNYQIIKSAPAFKLDKYYGGLILLPQPLNIITFLLLPFYVLFKDKERLLKLNSIVYGLVYAIIAVNLSAFFIAFNLLMAPFAYLKVCLHKFNLGRSGLTSFTNFFGYVIIGLPVLLVSQVTDLWAFLKTSTRTEKVYQSDEIFVISLQSFNMFYKRLVDTEQV